MKRLLVFFLLSVALLVFVGVIYFSPKTTRTQISQPNSSSSTAAVAQNSTTAIFVPYWTMDGKAISPTYTTAIYFGIIGNTLGVDTTEDGYKDIHRFMQSVRPTQKILLTIELLDQNLDEKLLHDSSLQNKIINQTLVIAQKNHFDGVVLDFEYKALAFDEVIKSVSNFSGEFAKKAHASHLLFYQTLYGDSVYRLRPYDISRIGKVSDGIFVLAYDFHKANGNPGPNFPLYPLPDEQYSFSQMVDDFSQKIPVQKISIVFGMFGYDWTVNARGQSISQAESLTTNQVLQKFIPHCTCMIEQNRALETKITYKDSQNQQHIVWFEDLTSIEDKKDVLSKKGISSIAFWASSYF